MSTVQSSLNQPAPEADPGTAHTTGAYAAFPVAETRALSIASLVLGISSLVFGFTFVVPAAGLVLGIMALTREPSSRVMSVWGIVLSGLTLGGGVVAVVLGLSLLLPAGLLGLLAI